MNASGEAKGTSHYCIALRENRWFSDSSELVGTYLVGVVCGMGGSMRSRIRPLIIAWAENGVAFEGLRVITDEFGLASGKVTQLSHMPRRQRRLNLWRKCIVCTRIHGTCPCTSINAGSGGSRRKKTGILRELLAHCKSYGTERRASGK